MLNGCENTVQCGTTVTESRMHSSVESPARIVIGLHQVSFDSFAGDYYFSEECVPLPPFPGGAGEKE
jgi:sulfur transfer protein SufE